jgi:putative membrane protein
MGAPRAAWSPGDVYDAAGSASVWVTLGLGALGLLYLAGWVRLGPARLQAPWRFRLVCFLLGLAVVWAAVASRLSSLDSHRLTFHMVQHLLLLNVSAPLLLLGAPFAVLDGVLPRRGVRGPGRGFRTRAGRFLTHPCVTWLSAAAVVVGWHLPGVLALTLHSPGWHALQQLSFLLAGLLFFWPVVLPWPAVPVWPRWTMPLYLFLATLPCDVLSAFLAFSGRVVYPHYLNAPHVDGTTALADQANAGALMWWAVTLGYLLPAILITLQLLSPAQRRPASGVSATRPT